MYLKQRKCSYSSVLRNTFLNRILHCYFIMSNNVFIIEGMQMDFVLVYLNIIAYLLFLEIYFLVNITPYIHKQIFIDM